MVNQIFAIKNIKKIKHTHTQKSIFFHILPILGLFKFNLYPREMYVQMHTI